MPFNCPYCNNVTDVPNSVEINVHTYSGVATIASECCGRPLMVRAIQLCSVQAVDTTNSHDDWNGEYSKHKKEPLHRNRLLSCSGSVVS